MASLISPVNDDEVIAGYLHRGNIAAAREYVAAYGLEGVHDDDVLLATRHAKEVHAAAAAEADRVAARLRALGEDDSALLITEQIGAHQAPPKADRFDLVIEPLRAIAAAAEQDLEVVRQRLRDQTAALSVSDESKARILERIGRGDEALAVEYLNTLQDGQPLPEVEQSHGDDFAEFFPQVVQAAADAQARGQSVVAAVRRARGSTGDPVDSLKEGSTLGKPSSRTNAATPINSVTR